MANRAAFDHFSGSRRLYAQRQGIELEMAERGVAGHPSPIVWGTVHILIAGAAVNIDAGVRLGAVLPDMEPGAGINCR